MTDVLITEEVSEVSDPRGELLAAASLYQRLPDARRRVRIREDAAVTQRQMADALGVSAMTLSRWERGVRPRARHAQAYLELLEQLQELATA
jgi:DNA-binding transcriptional regulator YiaG